MLNPYGKLEDSARNVPTVSRLLRRHLRTPRTLDYNVDHDQSIDWMAEKCLVFNVAAYQTLGGFDERFFLYCEGVDICLRANLAGWSVSWVMDAVVEHRARRDSWRKLRYLWWHLNSYAKLFRSSSCRRFCQIEKV